MTIRLPRLGTALRLSWGAVSLYVGTRDRWVSFNAVVGRPWLRLYAEAVDHWSEATYYVLALGPLLAWVRWPVRRRDRFGSRREREAACWLPVGRRVSKGRLPRGPGGGR